MNLCCRCRTLRHPKLCNPTSRLNVYPFYIETTRWKCIMHTFNSEQHQNTISKFTCVCHWKAISWLCRRAKYNCLVIWFLERVHPRIWVQCDNSDRFNPHSSQRMRRWGGKEEVVPKVVWQNSNFGNYWYTVCAQSSANVFRVLWVRKIWLVAYSPSA